MFPIEYKLKKRQRTFQALKILISCPDDFQVTLKNLVPDAIMKSEIMSNYSISYWKRLNTK
jgi:hypothetical protein